ncbi:MAG: phospho-sugar mutase [Cytophagales bacterium]|nr:phospho-sugar mutase [Cytophagales bacterium]
MEQEIREKINAWLNGSYDQETKNTIQHLLDTDQTEELVDSFYKDLEFGTGGLRGIMGVGSNRMNKYTIGAATQGLANYLKLNYEEGTQIRVAIAHDSRNNCELFTKTTADVFTANGFEVYLFESLRPTPELSFAIREFGCHAGVVLTASHNPKEYNGYKAYWNDGAQLIAPHDKNVITEVQKIQSIEEIKFEGNDDLITTLGDEFDEKYVSMIQSLSVYPEVIEAQSDLKIVFSPIHGTGVKLVPQVLEKFGFKNVHLVEEQSTPDGNFPTVVYPNPEEAEAMSIAVKKATELDADLVMATDPDSDRVGIAVKNNKGEFQLLNGNQTGSLLIYYLLDAWKNKNKLTGKEYIVKTIVTSELIDTIAESYKVECLNTLTGFKFIAGKILELEGKKQFIGGGEESYGYLVGDSVRDKDAIASCAFIAEMVAYAKNQGKSIFDLLLDLYVEYGFFKEHLISITKKGKAGAEEIQEMMKKFRENPPAEINGSKLVLVKDYENQVATNLLTGEKETIDLPKSNVLQFFTEDGTKISARPSGTEPKIKFYFGVKESLDSKENYEQVNAQLDEKIQNVIKSLELV